VGTFLHRTYFMIPKDELLKLLETED
jgi:hypothetical protein